MIYSKGITWFNDCRIPFKDEGDMKATTEAKYTIGEGKISELGFGLKKLGNFSKETGRFPPNLLVSDDMLNDGNIIQYNKTRKDNGNYLGGHREDFVGTDNNPIVNKIKGQFFNDKGSNSRYYDLDLWFSDMIQKIT